MSQSTNSFILICTWLTEAQKNSCEEIAFTTVWRGSFCAIKGKQKSRRKPAF